MSLPLPSSSALLTGGALATAAGTLYWRQWINDRNWASCRAMPSVAAPAHYQELAPMGFLPNRLWLNANAEYEEILHELRQQLDWLERGDGSKVLGRHRVELNTEYEQIWVLRASYEQDHTALLGPQADALLSGAQRVLSAVHDEGIALYHLYCKLSYVPRQTQQWLDMCARHLDLDAAKDIKVWYVGIQQRALMQKRHCVEVTDLLLTGKGLTLRRTLAELTAARLVLQRAAAHHEKDLASRVTHREARDQAEAAVKKAGQPWKRREEQLEDLHVSNKSRLANLEMQLREQKAFGGENAAAKQAADAERIKLLEEKLSRLWQDTQKAHSDLAEANERVGQADADLHKALVRLGQKISEQAQTSHKLTAVQQDRDWHDKGRTFMARKVAQQQGQIAGMARDAKTAEETLAAQIEQAEAHKAEAEVKAQALRDDLWNSIQAQHRGIQTTRQQLEQAQNEERRKWIPSLRTATAQLAEQQVTQSKLQVELAKRGSELIQLTRELKEQQHVIQDAEAVIRRNALPARSHLRSQRSAGDLVGLIKGL